MNKLYQISSDFATNSYSTAHVLGLILWKIMSPSSKHNEIYDFMGMTGSGKNRTNLEDFSFHGDELCVFFLNKEIRL